MQELSVVKLHHKTTHTRYINSGYNMFYRIIMMVWLSNLNSVALYSIGDFVEMHLLAQHFKLKEL